MKRLVSDEDFNLPILRGLLQSDPNIDLVRVVDVGLSAIKDPVLLAWAATQGRIVLSHDRKTMYPDARWRIANGELMTGLILVSQNCPTRRAIEEILLTLEWYAEEGWQNRIVTLPL
jgi:predicted nuclease of predicted toxin-antitoxin system